MVADTPKQVEKPPLHPNALKALDEHREATQWKPGQSGNPGGSSLKAKLQDAMDKPQVELGKDATVAELIVQATIKGAIEREPTPFKEVWDRTEGRVVEKHALLGKIDLVVRYVEKGE